MKTFSHYVMWIDFLIEEVNSVNPGVVGKINFVSISLKF